MKQSHTLIVVAIVIVVVVIGGWYAFSNPQIASALGLRHSAPNNMASTTMSMGSTTPGGRFAGGFTQGSIEVLNDNGFTLTLKDGTTKNVTFTATTTIQNFTSASSTPTTITSDQLSVGEPVTVIGMSQSDGSIDARRIETGTVPAPGQYGRGGTRSGRIGSTTPRMYGGNGSQTAPAQ